MRVPAAVLLLLLGRALAASLAPPRPAVWHALTLAFRGPRAAEAAAPNPFLHFRLDVVFTHLASNASYAVPGYFAADGRAAHTSAAAGDVWHARFAPPRAGRWRYAASFLAGPSAAVRPARGRPLSFNGDSGTFDVVPSTATAPDLRARGRLQYVGQRYLRFAAGGFRIKLGTNTPENLLAYAGFDADVPPPPRFTLNFTAHASDWREGDPTWGGGRGKELIGAVNYLADAGVNSLFAIVMTVRGDSDGAVHPWTAPEELTRYDVSKLAQWDIVFAHATRRGLALNLALTETENEALFEHAAGLSTETGFADARRLFYREIVARFAHHPGFALTLGEENGWSEGRENGGGFPWGRGNTHTQRRAFARYIRRADAYASPLGVHTYPPQKDAVYGPLLGRGAAVEAAALQLGRPWETYDATRTWVAASVAAGRPWVVSADEVGALERGAPGGVPLVGDGPLDAGFRASFAWANVLAGGAGLEVFSAGADQTLDDFRRLATAWREFARPVRLFEDTGLAFWAMDDVRDDVAIVEARARDPFVYALGARGDAYVVFRSGGARAALDLGAFRGKFRVRWFDPRGRGAVRLEVGGVEAVRGGGQADLGAAPRDDDLDWVAVVARTVPGAPRRWLTRASPLELVPGAVDTGALGLPAPRAGAGGGVVLQLAGS